ncbi:MAG: NADH-quinone oxidoreductase subunit L [Chloroflexi bacterium]|nr:NADH-quinone oxidoreductase subunit L [Chloroflexota bacterium]
MNQLIPLIPLIPIIGFAFSALFGRRLQARYGKPAASLVPVGLIVLTWLISMAVAATALTGGFGETGANVTLWQWIHAGTFTVDIGFTVDQLTAVLLIVVTTIGMLVHIYSIGYMSHDGGYWRFFAYLNLFMFSMLLLVLADNFLLVFAGWELVGLSSYALIGFWYRRPSAGLAAKKAFIVNRVGDVGFALGIMAIWVNTGTLNIRVALERLGALDAQNHGLVVVIALLVFCGAVGKSAQFPLHVWLPDAMEGPTPVSALIHAATMVNAGVYLVARVNPLFGHAQEAMVVVAAIGIFTAILAASIATTQTDIKRVLAYSTLSQLGYMFAALGVGAWAAAIFHLMAHGFFKGLLFLDSGSVIHSVGGEQDMRRMGGLSKKIPVTYWTMLIGAVAISGIPPLAGFFSKDEILASAFKNGFLWVWAVGFIVAGMTAFYMFRLIALTFWGESRVDPAVEPTIHESPRSMTVPLILLAIPSALLGIAIGLPPENGLLANWLRPVFESTVRLSGRTESYSLFGIDGALLLASVTVAVVGIAIAWRLFGVELGGLRRRADPARVRALSARVPFLYRASLNKWWFDDLYDLLFIRIGGRVAAAMWWFDRNVVDGAVNGIGTLTIGGGRELRRVQTGHVQNYALGIAVGLIVMAGSYLLIVGH